MKVKDLIKKLQLLDEEKEVVVDSESGCCRSELILITEAEDIVIIEGL